MTKPPLHTKCTCGRRWIGLTQAHCTAPGCHRHFGSVTGFDRHRATGTCADPATITTGSGQPYFKPLDGPYGCTWVRNNPGGHYRNDGKAATAIVGTATQ